jgi:hypothetical protein
MYEIQAEYIPGNNQLWLSFKDQADNFLYQYSTYEEAENMIPVLQPTFPEGTGFRIITKETPDENII